MAPFNLQAIAMLALVLLPTVLAQLSSVEPMLEHVVIIDKSQEQIPDVVEVLQRVGLDNNHPWVRRIFNNSAFTGFSARLPPCHADELNNMTDISLVEKSARILHTGVVRRATVGPQERDDAPWGLERLSNVFFRGSDTQAMDYTYHFNNDELGLGADIYVIDSGIWTEHDGFGGRASMIWSFDGNMTDTDGHGTHVAGTAAAADFGVASNANLFGVRVLNDKGRGTTATVIAGIDHVVQQHDLRKQQSGFRGSIISVSLAATGKVDALDQAIRAAVNAGVHACIAAGNDNEDACTGSPASSGGTNGPAIIVGSIDIDGKKSSFSNYGDCVDVYAPGQQILSAGMHDPTLLVFLTGTSQATPHVTGLVAYAMANQTLAQSPALMKEWVKSTAITLDSGMLLANNGAGGNTAEGMLGFSKQYARWNVRKRGEVSISRRNSSLFELPYDE